MFVEKWNCKTVPLQGISEWKRAFSIRFSAELSLAELEGRSQLTIAGAARRLTAAFSSASLQHSIRSWVLLEGRDEGTINR